MNKVHKIKVFSFGPNDKDSFIETTMNEFLDTLQVVEDVSVATMMTATGTTRVILYYKLKNISE